MNLKLYYTLITILTGVSLFSIFYFGYPKFYDDENTTRCFLPGRASINGYLVISVRNNCFEPDLIISINNTFITNCHLMYSNECFTTRDQALDTIQTIYPQNQTLNVYYSPSETRCSWTLEAKEKKTTIAICMILAASTIILGSTAIAYIDTIDR